MRRGLEFYLEVIFLVILLVLSAAYTFSAVEMISGLNADVAKDKVLVSSYGNKHEYEIYRVSDLLLAITRFDYGYPFNEIVVERDGVGPYTMNPKSEAILSDPSAEIKKVVDAFIMGDTPNEFFNREIDLHLSKDHNEAITCHIKIK